MSFMLQPTTPADLDFVLEQEQHPDNRRFILQWSRERHLVTIENADSGHWIVEINGQRVGYVILNGLTSPHGAVELARMVISAKGHGYGRQTLRAIKRIVFEEWGKHRLWLDVMTYNQRARSLYQSEGFIEEGIWRDALLIDGAYVSLVFMSILETEYTPS
ncbi:MAG: GNAT family N-acetyltransferase [Chloroflexi bacterium]|nr:GNAT family N-acetyltransferase [Chloroflexota bacterium]